MLWKKYQNSKKVKKKTRLALIVLGLIILVILLGNLVKFTKTLFRPWQLDGVKTKSYIWNGEFNINVVVKSGADISVASYNPKEGKLMLLNIPQTVLVEVPAGFGNWQLRSVYDLGETNKKGDGTNFLKQSVATLLGIPIDGFLDIGDWNGDFYTGDLIKSFFSIKTDLTLWELIRLKTGMASVRFDKVDKLDLVEVLDKSNLADGTAVFLADPVKIDSLLTGFADPALKMEHKTIAVFNGTDKSALAQNVTRMITNMGGNVIITANASKKEESSRVSGEKSKTFQRLNQLFDQSDNIVSSRAQINVILGADFAR